MVALTTEQAYATVTDADLYFSTNSVWSALTTEQKTDALLWGRYWIDITYDCSALTDTTRELVISNCLLALDYVEQGDLFFANDSTIKKERIKAGSVETETEYLSGAKQLPNSAVKVFALLSSICPKKQTINFIGRA